MKSLKIINSLYIHIYYFYRSMRINTGHYPIATVDRLYCCSSSHNHMNVLRIHGWIRKRGHWK